MKQKKPPVARRRRSTEEIMEGLITAAREEFKRCGYAGATTAAIARKANISEAQLFRYFDSKSDLFRESVFEPLNEHFKAFSQIPLGPTGNENVRELTRFYIAELQQFLGEHSKLLLSLVVAQLHQPDSLQDSTDEIESLRRFFEHTAELMDNRLDKPKVDPKLMVRVAFSAVLGCVLFKDWVFPRELASDEAISAAIIDFVIDGVSVNNDPGLKQNQAKR